MDRRAFVGLLGTAPLALAQGEKAPPYRVVTSHRSGGPLGMPGPFPGKVVAVRSDRCVDVESNAANADVVREMMARGLCDLTGESTVAAAWRRFFEPSDVVGIKVNCGGHPWVVSSREIVAEAVTWSTAIVVAASLLSLLL